MGDTLLSTKKPRATSLEAAPSMRRPARSFFDAREASPTPSHAPFRRLFSTGDASVDTPARGGVSPSMRHTFALGQLVNYVGDVSSFFSIPPEPTFRCHICFGDEAVSTAATLKLCGHRFCEACFKSYLEMKIAEGNVHPVCFHPIDERTSEGTTQKTCGCAVDVAQMQSLVDAETWAKYERFRFNQEHKDARDCPYCSHSQDCRGDENPVCTCEKCGKPFCFFHGNAHEAGTCADYELKHAETEALNRTKIQEISKPCPGCQRNVEKAGGCNHMRCVACKTNFCWLCSEVLGNELTSNHFSASNGGPCSGKQFDGTDNRDQPWWLRLYITIAIAVCVVPAIAIGIVLTPFAWCYLPANERPEAFERIITIATVVLQAPLAVVFFGVAAVVYGVFCVLEFMWTVLSRLFRSCCRAQPSPTGNTPTTNGSAGQHDAMEARIDLPA